MAKQPDGTVRWWIEHDGPESERPQIVVSAADARRHPAHGDTRVFQVTDLLTGKRVRLRRADCGLGCQCALEFAPRRKRATGGLPQGSASRLGRLTKTEDRNGGADKMDLPEGHNWREIPCNLTGTYLWHCTNCNAGVVATVEQDGSTSTEFEPCDDPDCDCGGCAESMAD